MNGCAAQPCDGGGTTDVVLDGVKSSLCASHAASAVRNGATPVTYPAATEADFQTWLASDPDEAAIAAERRARSALERSVAELAAEVVAARTELIGLSFDLIALLAGRGVDVTELSERVARQSVAVFLSEWGGPAAA